MINIPDYSNLYLPHKLMRVRAAVQFIHGLGTNQEVYKGFADFLASCGYACLTSDLRGHGKNIHTASELGYMGEKGAAKIVGDIHDLTRVITERCPGVPYIMIGHDMGALIAAAYLKKYDNFLDGIILSGIPTDEPALSSRLRLMAYTTLKGDYYRTRSFETSLYHSKKKQDDNPKLGFTYTLNGYKTFQDLYDDVFRRGSMVRKNTKLPIRIIAGSKDASCAGRFKMGKAASLFTAQGYLDVETHTLGGLRHDIYLGEGKKECYEYILGELGKITS